MGCILSRSRRPKKTPTAVLAAEFELEMLLPTSSADLLPIPLTESALDPSDSINFLSNQRSLPTLTPRARPQSWAASLNLRGLEKRLQLPTHSLRSKSLSGKATSIPLTDRSTHPQSHPIAWEKGNQWLMNLEQLFWFSSSLPPCPSSSTPFQPDPSPSPSRFYSKHGTTPTQIQAAPPRPGFHYYRKDIPHRFPGRFPVNGRDKNKNGEASTALAPPRRRAVDLEECEEQVHLYYTFGIVDFMAPAGSEVPMRVLSEED